MSPNSTLPADLSGSPEQALLGTLPVVERLALAYAPARARQATLALFALDTRLAGLLRHSREPMLAQLRLAWWRENLDSSGEEWPTGEPLLAALRSWEGKHQALIPLVDGWEALTGPAPLAAEALETMVAGRGDAFAALARVLDADRHVEEARQLGRQWAIADLAMRLSNAQERATVLAMRSAGGTRPRVSRALRPLLVLQALAERRLEKGSEAAVQSPAALLTAMRLGLLGF